MPKSNARKAAIEALKSEAVLRVRLNDERPADVARTLGIDPPVLAAWLAKAKLPPAVAALLNKKAALEAEIDRLDRENASLREDIEILQKAEAFAVTHEE